MTTSTQELLGPFLGQHSVPALAGVHGTIGFEGPRGKLYTQIDDGRVNVTTKSDHVDAMLKSDEEGVLIKLVSGELNAVVAVLQGRVEGEGDMLLAPRSRARCRSSGASPPRRPPSDQSSPNKARDGHARSVSVLDGNAFAVSDRRGDIERSGMAPTAASSARHAVSLALGHHHRRQEPQRASRQRHRTTGRILHDSSRPAPSTSNSHLSVVRRASDRRRGSMRTSTSSTTARSDGPEVDDRSRLGLRESLRGEGQLPKKGDRYREIDRDRLVLGYRRDKFARETWVGSPRRLELTQTGLRVKMHLPAHGSWSTTCVRGRHRGRPQALQGRAPGPSLGHDARRPAWRSDLEHGSADWVAPAPRLSTSWDPLQLTYRAASSTRGAALPRRVHGRQAPCPPRGCRGSWRCSGATVC